MLTIRNKTEQNTFSLYGSGQAHFGPQLYCLLLSIFQVNLTAIHQSFYLSTFVDALLVWRIVFINKYLKLNKIIPHNICFDTVHLNINKEFNIKEWYIYQTLQ